jgi:rieske iron-sulfur protein
MMSTTGSSYKCEECDTSFNSETEFDEHIKYAKYRRKVVVGNNVAKTDDLLLNKDAFRTRQLIRLPAELGGDKNDVSAFRLYSAVCLHLWCLWRYVPLERDSNDPSRIINGSGQCPCHDSAYDPLNRKAFGGPAADQSPPSNVLPILYLEADQQKNLWILPPTLDVNANGIVGYGRFLKT